MRRLPKPGVLLVARREWRWLMHDYVALILIFGVPLFAFVVLSLAFSHPVIRGLGVAVVDADRSEVSRAFLEQVSASSNISVVERTGDLASAAQAAGGQPGPCGRCCAASSLPRYGNGRHRGSGFGIRTGCGIIKTGTMRRVGKEGRRNWRGICGMTRKLTRRLEQLEAELTPPDDEPALRIVVTEVGQPDRIIEVRGAKTADRRPRPWPPPRSCRL